MIDVVSQEAPSQNPHPGISPMFSAFLELAKEYKTPVSFLFILALSIVVGWLVQTHVSPDQVADLNRKLESMQNTLDGVRYTLKFDHLDTRHHTIRTDIFNLTQHIKDEAPGREDRLELQRLDELKGEEEDINRQLDILRRNSKE